MATANRKKASAAPTSIKRKSAMDTLLDTMQGIIEDGARGMTPKERQESEKKFNAVLDRAVASRKRRLLSDAFDLDFARLFHQLQNLLTQRRSSAADAEKLIAFLAEKPSPEHLLGARRY